MPAPPSLPKVYGPEALAAALPAGSGPATGRGALRVVDLRPDEARAAGRIEGAVPLDKALLNRSSPPYGGLMPDRAMLEDLIRRIDLREGEVPVAVDAGGATEAARFCWVLHVAGLTDAVWLEGGMAGWRAAGLPMLTDAPAAPPAAAPESAPDAGARAPYRRPADPAGILADGLGDGFIDADALAARLGRPALRIIDVRGAAEYAGTDVRSAEGGHVPGALHYEWTRQFDATGRLREPDALRADLAALDVLPEHEVVVYCQTHQRSAVTWRVLTALGYPTVRGLDGAWSVWGNRADLPKAR